MSVTLKVAGSQGSVSLSLVRIPERVDDLRPGGHDWAVGRARSSASSAGATCPRTHAAGGSRSSISVRRCSNPASVSRPASSLAAAAEVAAVAPGQRGWDTRAIRPPGRNSRASSRSRAVGSGHMPTVLTASAALNGPSLMDRRSTGVWIRRTRPARMAALLRRRAWRSITCEWSTPTTNPRTARVARAAMATPGPQPSSMTRSVGWTSRSCTAQRLRATFDERRPLIQPATCPRVSYPRDVATPGHIPH
jgi:hypothetical protein